MVLACTRVFKHECKKVESKHQLHTTEKDKLSKQHENQGNSKITKNELKELIAELQDKLDPKTWRDGWRWVLER